MALADAETVVSGWRQAVQGPVASPLPVLYPLPGASLPRPVMERVPSTLEPQEAADAQH